MPLSFLFLQASVIDPSAVAGFSPAGVFIFLLFLTFVTEDGACLLAGTLAASGIISLELGIGACFSGIFIGDTGLFFIGRTFGRSVSRSRILSRLVSQRTLDKSAAWLEKRGFVAILISRFVTGLRLPTYLAAGFLGASFTRFAAYFVIAAALWTPLLVVSAYYAQALIFGTNFVLGAIALFVLVRVIFAFTSRVRRRRFLGSVQKLYRWEFWPVQVFYLPVVAYIGLLALRHRSLTIFTCTNPAIPAGGFIGESKNDIYAGLAASPAAAPFLLKHRLIDPSRGSANEREMPEGLGFPIVVKPDAGERGRGVTIVHDADQFESAVAEAESPLIIQEFAPGEEFSVFYFRFPDEKRGRIFSVTAKEFPVITGDGESTVEELILSDPRAVCIARAYLDEIDSPERVLMEGEQMKLIEIGTHARGAIFNDGSKLISERLETVIDEICRGYEGFYFGRFDIRAASAEAFRNGRDLKIVELNGVTSESTNIYDPSFSLLKAYATLFRQWRLAFQIGRANHRRGVQAATVGELWSMLLDSGGSADRLNEETA